MYGILKKIHIKVSVYLQFSHYNYITIYTKMKFTESVNVRDTTSDESDQESIDSNYTNHNLENSNEEDVNIITRGNNTYVIIF